MTASSAFEAETCGRCHGTGTYSYTQRWGTTCFKCGTTPHVAGRGWTLTKRGAAAAAFMCELLSKPASQIVAGESIRDTMSGRWCKVASVEDDGRYAILSTERVTFHMAPNTMLRVAASADEKKAAIDKAVAYQATLTKRGTPRKRRASGGAA